MRKRDSSKSTVRDMTEGNPLMLILSFAVPTLLGMLFQQFYSMVDTVIVGRCLGVDALAAVGSTGAVNFMINGFVIGICSGFAIPVAQCFGAKDYKDMRRFVANAVWLSVIFAAVMTIVISMFTWDILEIMKTPENIIQGAYDYIYYIFLGIPATFLYNVLAGMIRSLGDSKTPVYFLVLSSILNIGLDLLFILAVGSGVAGAAYATVLSQAVSGLLCLAYMRKRFPILRMERDEIAFKGSHARTLCYMGIPMGLQYSITAIGSVVIQTAINSLGSVAVASVATAQKSSLIFCCPFDALGGTMATYAGQNVGAKQFKRIESGVKSATLVGCVYSLLAFAVLVFFGRWIPLLFVDVAEEAVIGQAHQYMIYSSMFFPLLTFVNVWRFTIQGLGYSAFAILAGVCEMVGRAFVGFCLVPVFGFIAVCFASPLAWLLADLFLVPAFWQCMKRLRLQGEIRDQEEAGFHAHGGWFRRARVHG